MPRYCTTSCVLSNKTRHCLVAVYKQRALCINIDSKQWWRLSKICQNSASSCTNIMCFRLFLHLARYEVFRKSGVVKFARFITDVRHSLDAKYWRKVSQPKALERHKVSNISSKMCQIYHVACAAVINLVHLLPGPSSYMLFQCKGPHIGCVLIRCAVPRAWNRNL